MTGLLLALLLGGAPAAPPVGEAWTPANLQLAPAVVVSTDNLEALLKEVQAEPAEAGVKPAVVPAQAEPGPFATPFMPSQLERAVVRPAL